MRAMILSMAVVAIIICHGTAPAGGAPDLTGSWQVITSEWHSEKHGFNVDKPSHMKLTVTGQKRKVFWGNRIFWNVETRAMHKVPFSGVIGVGNSQVFIKEQGQGIAYGDLISDGKMYLYFMEDGGNAKILLWEIVRIE